VIQHAFIELLTFVLAMPLRYLMAKYIKKLSAGDYRYEIDSDYLREWKGEPDDEYYAWLRLRYRYISQDSPGIYLKHIDRRIDELSKRDMLSGFSINTGGDVVPTNTFNKNDPEINSGPLI
jgi:hypothetical protein